MSRLRSSGWILPLSLSAAFLLGLLPLSETIAPFRPYWLALVLMYWAIECPATIGLGTAFGCGVIADVLYGGRLGEQSLRLIVIIFLVERFRARLRFFPLPQQAIVVGGLLVNDFVVLTILHLTLGEPILAWTYAWSASIGTLFWPPIFIFLDALRLGQRNRK